jgi:hypothetical protein
VWKFYSAGEVADNTITVGYFSRAVRLYASDLEPFRYGFSLQFTDTSAFLGTFSIYPNYIRANLNDPYLQFYVAAKPNAQPGVYKFTTTLSQGDSTPP